MSQEPWKEINKRYVVEYMNNTPPKAQNTINHPQHYGGDTTYEVIKVIEAWSLGFHLGNVVKYIYRCDKKGDLRENIDKAIWYLERYKEKYVQKGDNSKPDRITSKDFTDNHAHLSSPSSVQSI